MDIEIVRMQQVFSPREVCGSAAMRAIREIERRTNLEARACPRIGKVTFCLPQSNGGPVAIPIRILERGEQSVVDDAVRTAGMARIARREKDREHEKIKASADNERQAETRKESESLRPEAKNYAAFLDRKRRGTAKVTSLVTARPRRRKP